MGFTKAQRTQTKLRMAVDGPSGSGKTFTGLRCSFALGARIAVICSENGSAQKYQGESPDGIPWDFDILILRNYSPTAYTDSIKEAGKAGYDVLLIDSLSHAWTGEGGALDIKDKQGGNSFTAWKNVTPMHNRMIEAILTAPMHVIATMRSKTAYVLESDDKGKQVPKKVGMEPVQRAGMEYEFDIYASLDLSHILKITKSRCRSVDGAIVSCPGPEFMRPVAEWLNSGTPTPRAIPLCDQLVDRLLNAVSIQALDQAANECKAMKRSLNSAEWSKLCSIEQELRKKLSVPVQMDAAVRDTVDAPKQDASSTDTSPQSPGESPERNGTHDQPATEQQLLQIARHQESFMLRHARCTKTSASFKPEWLKFLSQWKVDSAKKLTHAQANECIMKMLPEQERLTEEQKNFF